MRSNERSNKLMLIMSLYLCTLFIYKDFGVRMILGYALLGAAFLFAMLQRPYLKMSKDIVIYILIVLTVLLSFAGPGARLDRDTIAYAVLMVVSVLYVLSIRMSVDEYEKIERIIYVAAAVFAVLVVISRLNRDIYLHTVYKLLTSDAQELAHDDLWHGYSCPIGGDETYHNYMFMIAAMFSLGNIVVRKKDWKKHYFIALFFVFASFLTGRRGEFLALFLICAGVGIYILPRKQRRRVLWITLLIALIAVPFIPRLLGSTLMSRFAHTVEQAKSGSDFVGGRMELWGEAIRIFLLHPVFGIGWGGYANFVTEEFRAAHGDVFNVHNIYLQFLAETGIVGTLIIVSSLLALLFMTLHQALAIKNNNAVDDTLKKMNLISLGIQGYYLLMGFLDPCFMKYYFWIFYAFAFSLQQFVRKSRSEMPGQMSAPLLKERKNEDLFG